MKRTSPELISEIIHLAKSGYTPSDIAKSLNVNERTVRRYAHGFFRCQGFYRGMHCQRTSGHRGIHLSDESGKLIHWE